MALTVTRNYSDGNTLTEQQLDDAFDSIETYLNVVGIGQDNIQDNAVGTSELQANAVTETKIATAAVTTSKILDEAVTNPKIAAGTIARDRLVAALQDAFNPVGSIIMHGANSAPTGYLLCDGSAISRVTYVDLFTAIGIVHGAGDGTTTFHIPDLRGRFVRGRDAGQGRDPDAGGRTAAATGGNSGDAVGSLQGDAFAAHVHTINGAPDGAFGGLPNTAQAPTTGAGSTNSTGASTETRPKNVNLLFCIKY